jgi:hypothetical protein
MRVAGAGISLACTFRTENFGACRAIHVLLCASKEFAPAIFNPSSFASPHIFQPNAVV